MSSKQVSFAADVAEGSRPLKRGATQIVNASADNDDIFDDSGPKRRREENEETREREEEEKSKSKHTLDSDEEDEDKYERLDMKKVDGQEDQTIEYDGDTKITAFNMKEEEEDGHFDASGNFIFDKKEKDIKDAWLDEIDWSRVKKNAGKDWQGEEEENDDDMALPTVMTDDRKKEIFTKLYDLLKPEQTVSKALMALKKGKGMTIAEERKARWAAKKAGKEFVADDNGKLTDELASLADELLTAGHMDAYEWSREKVARLLKLMSSTPAVDDVDMFGDAQPAPAAEPSTSSETAKEDKSDLMNDEVMWEYKEDEEAKVQGPFTSAQMAEKQEKQSLGPKALVRKVGSGGFNPAARIDFDLYI